MTHENACKTDHFSLLASTYFISFFLTDVSACTSNPPPKLTAANILLTEPPEQRGISAVNANTHIRWKSSHSGAWRHSHDLERRTLFRSPKRQAVGSNPAGIIQKPVLTANLLGERFFCYFMGVVANKIVTDVGNLLKIMTIQMVSYLA